MIKLKISKKMLLKSEDTVLDEGRKDDAIKKYGGDPKRLEAIEYFTANPIANNKYLNWMLDHLDEAPSKEHMQIAVSDYERIQKNIETGDPLRDIATIQSYEQLMNVVDDYKKSIRELEKEGQKVVISKEDTGGRFEVIRPMNVYASCDLNSNSVWCIAATKSKNYYRSYSSRNVVFYTIIDHSKPRRDKNSMFAYAIVQGEESRSPEIYNAVDTIIKRPDVAKLIGKDNEEWFYNSMIEESAKGVKSTLTEKYNTFFMRLMKWVKTLPKEIPQDDREADYREKFMEVTDEIAEFYKTWFDVYRTPGSSSAADVIKLRNEGQRQMVLFTKKLTTIDHNIIKLKTGNLIEEVYSSVPGLMELVPDLSRDTKWLETAQQKFELYNSKISNEENYSTAIGMAILPNREDLGEFARQAIYNNSTDYIDKLLSTLNKIYREIGLSDIQEVDIEHAKTRIRSYRLEIIKTCIRAGYDGIKQVLVDMISNSNTRYIAKTVSSIMNELFSIAKIPAALKQYGPTIIDSAIKAINTKDSIGKDQELKDLSNVIVRIQNLDKKYYHFAIQNGNETTSVNFTNHQDINILDLPTQETIADYVINFTKKHSRTPMSEYTLSYACYGTLKSKSLPKNKISDVLEELFSNEKLISSLHRLLIEEIIDRWGRDSEITSPAFDEYLKRYKLKESKIFSKRKLIVSMNLDERSTQI